MGTATDGSANNKVCPVFRSLARTVAANASLNRPIAMQVACRANSDDGFAINNRRHGRGRELRQPLPALAAEYVDVFRRCGKPQFRAGPLFRRAFQLRREFCSVVLDNVRQSVFAELLDQVQSTRNQSLGIGTELQMCRPRADYFLAPAMQAAFGQKIVRLEEVHFPGSDELRDE